MATAEGTFPKTGNDPIYASEINTLPIMQTYTGNGFDSSVTAIGTDVQDHELTALTATQIAEAQTLMDEKKAAEKLLKSLGLS